jgi:metal-responsive CopG/Arc/MetJ family transcriptional regulator
VKLKMAVINISIPQELIEKVDSYKKIVKKNRSEFFADAVKEYFNKVEEYIAHKRQIKAIKGLIEIGKQMQRDGVFKEDFDVVEEIRRLRQERTDELLRRVQ